MSQKQIDASYYPDIISILAEISVKIECVNDENEVKNTGTGTLFSKGGSYYVITAAHCIQFGETQEHFKEANIWISLPQKNNAAIKVSDVLIFNLEDTIDFALLAVKFDTDIFLVNYENCIRFISEHNFSEDIYFYAFISKYPNGRLFKIHKVSQDDNYTIEDKPSATGADLKGVMEGSSGSGIFVECEKRLYYLGYVKSYIPGDLDDIKIRRIPNDIIKKLGCQLLKQSVQEDLLICSETNDNTNKKATDIDGLPTGKASRLHSKVTIATKPHPQAIDLGLPSGTQWACCNVGADKPEAYGGFYAWGETKEKSIYDWSTYIHCDGDGHSCTNLGNNIAGTQYDIAHIKWGSNWQMPTFDQFKELFDYCHHKWTTLNGIKGRKFTSNLNGNSIFLPAVGYRWKESHCYSAENGFYWSSTQRLSLLEYAFYLYFGSNNVDWGCNCGSRFYGLMVRPVLFLQPQAIDLGLPSGTKWASCNVGATKPEEYGGYFAWGETEEKKRYTWDSYIHCDGDRDSCRDIGRDIASTQYDVAHVKWGDNWRMPTIKQFKELLANCIPEWTKLNGIDGVKLKSKFNGNSIFLPAAGYRINSDLDTVGSYGKYWSSEKDLFDLDIAYGLDLNSGYANTGSNYRSRCNGRSVRPVFRI